jgi:hypothetical protein
MAVNQSASGNMCIPDPQSLFYNLEPEFMVYYFGIITLIAVVNIVGNFLVLR